MKRQKQNSRKDEQFEIHFLEGVLKESPDFVEALIQLGHLYTKFGFFDKGLSVDRKLATLRPNDPVVFYNLSCSYSLTGQIDKAFAVLQMAIEQGYQDFEHLSQDKDLKNLHIYPPFQKYFLNLRKTRSYEKL